LDRRVRLAPPVRMERMELMEPPDHRVRLEPQDLSVLQVQLAPWARLDRTELPAQLEPRDRLVHKVRPEPPVQLVP
jgi:hypothetical protein